MGSFPETYNDLGFCGVMQFWKQGLFLDRIWTLFPCLLPQNYLRAPPPVNVTFTRTQSLTKNRYCRPYIIELIVKTGFQSSLKIKEF